jgi:hypothetical protein
MIKTQDTYKPQIGISYANGFPMNYRVGNHIINPTVFVDISTGIDTRTGKPLPESKLEK